MIAARLVFNHASLALLSTHSARGPLFNADGELQDEARAIRLSMLVGARKGSRGGLMMRVGFGSARFLEIAIET